MFGSFEGPWFAPVCVAWSFPMMLSEAPMSSAWWLHVNCILVPMAFHPNQEAARKRQLLTVLEATDMLPNTKVQRRT